MATAILSRVDFPELIEPKHRELFYDSYYQEVAMGYPTLFDELTMGKPTESFQHIGAFGKWTSNIEGGKINISQMSEGDTAEYTAVRYDNSYLITHEMMRDDLSGVLGGAGKLGAGVVNNAPELLGRGARDLEDFMAANVLTGGFANTGYDGVALFHAAHPLADSADTYDNLATGALSPANLKTAITKLRTQTKSEASLRMVATAKWLIVPPSLQWVAAEIIQSFKQAYENSNTENVLPSLNIFVYDRLEDTGDTYAASNWFVKADNYKNLIFGWLERAFFGADRIPGTLDWQCYGCETFVPSYVNARGIVGSTGA